MSSEEQLYHDNERLVYFMLHRHFPQLVHDEDIVQCGKMGLWKACMSFDKSKSRFATYAIVCIRNEVLTELRKRDTKGIITVSLDGRASYNDTDAPLTLAEVIPDERDLYADIESENLIYSVLNSLEGRTKEIFDLMLRGYSQKKNRRYCWPQSILCVSNID